MTMTAPCPDDGRLRAYLQGELSGTEHASLEDHLEDCPGCLARLPMLDHHNSRVAGLLRWVLPPRPPAVPGYTYEEEAGSPKLLGSGGLGVVYQARRDRDGRVVAIKFVQVGPDGDALPRVRFVREVEAALGLSQDEDNGIVRAFDFGTAGGRLYYVMEFVRGKNLFDFLAGAPLAADMTEVARWGIALARAIQHAHANGIVHRDLKPSNVMVELDEEQRPVAMKITDFGMARRMQTVGHYSRNQPVGTLVYMAPEQLSGGQSLSPTVDVYGLGAILYFMLTGRPLFNPRRSEGDLHRALLHEDPVPPRQINPDVPYPLETIVLKCLRKRPEDRYSSAEELAGELQRFREGKRPSARRQTQVDRAVSWVRHNPRPAVGMGIIFGLFLLAGFLGAMWRTQKRDADRHADQARQNEAIAKDHAFARQRDAARFALARGQLAAALPLYDQIVAAAPPEQRPALEVERLRCLFAHRFWDRLTADLERLGGRNDLPAPLRAQVLLHRGDMSLWEASAGKQEAGRALVRAALALPDGLAPADAAYARGLIDDSALAAIRQFEEALRHDRFHLRANAALLVELALTGQFERAKRQADFMTAVFPNEPVTPLALALVATLEEDVAARRHHLTTLERILGDPSRMNSFRGIFAALDRSIRDCRRVHGTLREPAWLRMLRGFGLEQTFLPEATLGLLHRGVVPLRFEGVGPAIGVGLPALARPGRMVEMLFEAYRRLGKGDTAGAAALMEKAGKNHPESLIHLLHATAHLRLALALERKRDMIGCMRESRRAHALAEEAAEAPTLLPFGPYRHNARWICLLVEAGWSAQSRYDGAILAGDVLPVGGTNRLAAAVCLVAGGTVLRTYPVRRDRRHVLRVAADSHGYDEARSNLLPALWKYFEPDDARLLLVDWASDDPDDPVPYQLAARLEQGQGNTAEALRWVERGLARNPWNRELRAQRDRLRRTRR